MSPRRLLFGLLSPGLGGHTRTALAIADALRERGHAIEVLVATPLPAGETDALVRAAGFDVVSAGPPYRRSFRPRLRALVEARGYDAVHWFELNAGVRDAACVAASLGRAFVWTVTSGGPPVRYHGLSRVVVFTPEVAADARRRSPGTDTLVLPARVDMRGFAALREPAARLAQRQRLGVPPSDLLIVRVARCAAVYAPSVRRGIGLARRLWQEGRGVTFLHVGYPHDPAVAAEIGQLVAEVNAMAGRPIARSITTDTAEGVRYAAAADVCIASGRSAIDAIALGRATVLAWGARYLGLVDDDGIEAMAATNFQGRLTERERSDEAVIDDMYRALHERWAAPAHAARIEQACAEFVTRRYAVEHAAGVYERLYADRDVRVEPAWRYYSTPGVVLRESVRRLPRAIQGHRAVVALQDAFGRLRRRGVQD